MTSIRRITRRFSSPLLTLLPADVLAAFAALYAGAWLRFGFDLGAAVEALGPLPQRAASFALCIVLGLATMGLYRARQRPRLFEGITRILAGVLIGGVTHAMLFYLVPALNTGRLTLAWGMVLSFFVLSGMRVVLLRWLDRNPAKRKVLLFGSGRVAAKVGLLRRRSDRRRFEIVGFIPGSVAERRYAEEHGLGPLHDVSDPLDDLDIDELVVALDDRRGTFPTQWLLQHHYAGVPVRDIVEFLEDETGKIELDILHPGWLIFSQSCHSNWALRIAKRAFDVSVSLVMLTVMSPLLLVTAISVRIEGGLHTPLLYRQRRVGRDGQVFELVKFRSMDVGAESDGPQWAARKNDSRVTRVGNLIRRFRVDELPQLLNVLAGEMSIVGPRPERPEFVGQLNRAVPLYHYRHCMQPGLTGWAQLNFPYGASVEDAAEKLKFDLFYIKNAGIVLDLLILLQTLEVVIWGRAVSMAGSPQPQPRVARGGRPNSDTTTMQQQLPLPGTGEGDVA